MIHFLSLPLLFWCKKFLEKVIYAILDWVKADDMLHVGPAAIFGSPPNEAGLRALHETGN